MKPSIAFAFFLGVLTAAIACGSASPVAPSVTETISSTVHAQQPAAGFSFPSGAGMTEQGEWLFIRGRATQHYGPVGVAGTVHLTSLDGSGTRFLCVNGSNAVFASTTPCR